MYCEHCGSKLPDDSNFCPDCGADVTPPNPLPEEDMVENTAVKNEENKAVWFGKTPEENESGDTAFEHAGEGIFSPADSSVSGEIQGTDAPDLGDEEVIASFSPVEPPEVAGFGEGAEQYGELPASFSQQGVTQSFDNSGYIPPVQPPYGQMPAYAPEPAGTVQGTAPGEQKKKKKLLLIVIAGVLVLVLAAAAVGIVLFQRNTKYEEALDLMNKSSFQEAHDMFKELGNYKDAPDYVKECISGMDYKKAEKLFDAEKYTEAKSAFDALGKYSDSQKRAQDCQNVLDFAEAEGLMGAGDFAGAKTILETLKQNGYKDADAKLTECQNNISYQEADAAFQAGNFYTAYKGFKALSSFSDASDRAAACIQANPASGVVYRSPEHGGSACKLTAKLDDLGDGMSSYLKIYTPEDVLVATMFINPGASAAISLPAGNYRIKQAIGKNWFGTEEMYGDELLLSNYQVLTFDGGADTVALQNNYIYTLSLRSAAGGDNNVGSQNTKRDGF